MNQGIAFARTLRALDADDFRASKLGLLAAAALVAAWAWWMLAARIPQYESTTKVQIEHGRALAYFRPDALAHIQPGQLALVRVNGSTISSRVQSISSDHIDLAWPANPQSPTPASSSASVDIEITRVSPAAITLRTLTRGSR